MLIRSEKRWVTAEADPRVAEDIARTHGFSRAMARALVTTKKLVKRKEFEQFISEKLVI